ncbi:MAG: DNA recombination protein RmuC, partial [Sulfuricurvum sp.]|nr:DNA recombination protein RmuC [Sulfuricurvum sp.]
MLYPILFIAALLSTVITGWALMRSRQNLLYLQSQNEQLQNAVSQEYTARMEIQTKHEVLNRDYHALERDYAILHTRHEESSRSFEEKIRLLDEAKAQMKVQFEQLAAQIFEQKAKTFDEAHTKGLDLLLKPFREQIAQFATQSKEQFIHDAKERQSIKDEILRLKTLNERLSQDAINLTQALKGENKTQGNWGEIVLERILEESGLREGHEYEVQSTLS